MQLKQDKRSGVWKIQIHTAKGRQTITTGTTDHRQARQIALASEAGTLEAAARSGGITQELIAHLGGARTLDGATAEWLAWLPHSNATPRTVDAYADHVRAFTGVVGGDTRVRDVDEAAISRWINDPRATTSKGTRDNKLAGLRSLFEYCTVRRWCDYNPARLVRVSHSLLTHDQKQPRRRLPFAPEEIGRLLAAAAPFWRAAITVARDTGLRLGDICQLEWAAVDQGCVFLDKTNRKLAVEFSDAALTILRQIPRDGRFCFPDQQRLIVDPQRRAHLSTQFSRLCAKAGIEGKSFHGLRNTYAQGLGQPIEVVAEKLGHAGTAVTGRYL